MTKDEALDKALVALEHAQYSDEFAIERGDKAITAIKQARSAPTVQEPVAWLQIGLAPFHDGDVIARTTKPKAWNPEWWRFEPLYTTPPAAQRQWVGLTDDEYFEIGQRHWVTSTKIELIHAEIEAKLKEKNT